MVCVALFVSCVHTAERSSLESSVPDYGETHAWITPFESQYPVDVFYVYPTVSHNESGNMDVMNEEDRALAQGIFAAQASLFQGNANIYAPYYRQMSTGAKVSDDPNVLATELPEFKEGASDVQSAFRYYIEHLNQGRPFILAGHSQGSMALIELIKSELGNDVSLREQLVAAYLIGYTVTDEDLRISRLHAAEGADDTGVVITFNTQSPASVGGPMLLAGAHCINPLSWKTDDTPCEATLNKGAVFFQ